MLEFINATIHQLERKTQERGNNPYFKHHEKSIFDLKKIDLVQKLVYEHPYDESLVSHISKQRNLYLGNTSISEDLLQQTGTNSKAYLSVKDIHDRWEITSAMTNRAKNYMSNTIIRCVRDLDHLNEEMEELESKRLGELMKTLDIVAMTTTGASKYRQKLRKVGAQIVMVEEAAEVLEAQIVTSLTEHTKQLILIGDHMQLKPKVNSFVLSEEYGLSISLFERLVSRGVPNVRLNEQRRMRPEISELVRLIYPDLQDHDSVKTFEDIR
jgi:hypothetical protein